MVVKFTTLISLVGFGMLVIFSGVTSKPIRKPNFNGDGSDLKLLQKSVVKIIETESGDTFDCIDFYEQPALKHSSLKNHNFHPQMRPSSSPKRTKNAKFSRKSVELDIKLKDGGCPDGTVPIQRMDEEKLVQFEFSRQNVSGSSRTDPNSIFRHTGTSFALGETIRDPGANHYNGAGASLTVYNPKVTPNQYSSSELIIQNDLDMIEVGWTVNPHMYKDTEARIFVSTISGRTHCFNANCGFVIVNKDFPMGARLTPVSIAGGAQTYTYKFFVYKDSESGNWWLKVGEAGTNVGFWPKQFFTGLASPATYVACGGEVYRPSWETSGAHPEMGSGYVASHRDRRLEAYCEEFVMVDEAHQVVRATGTQAFASNAKYTVIDNPKRDGPEHFVFYGGPMWNY